MFDIKNIYIQIFLAIKNDDKLLDLLEITHGFDVDDNTFLTSLRKQILEMSEPNDLLNDYSTKICVHERDGTYSARAYEEVGYVCIDIHIAKDRNVRDNRLSEIVKRIIEVLDTKQRLKQGLNKLDIGLYGLTLKTRTLNELSNSSGWEKYSIVFEYKYIV